MNVSQRPPGPLSRPIGSVPGNQSFSLYGAKRWPDRLNSQMIWMRVQRQRAGYRDMISGVLVHPLVGLPPIIEECCPHEAVCFNSESSHLSDRVHRDHQHSRLWVYQRSWEIGAGYPRGTCQVRRARCPVVGVVAQPSFSDGQLRSIEVKVESGNAIVVWAST